MINFGQIKKALDPYYTNISDPDDNQVIRCERHDSKGRAYQKFYFDISSQTERLNNIRSYVRELVGTEYFDSAGNIKWNYYLAFITEKDVDQELRQIVEADDDYARKYVIQRSALDDWLLNSYVTKTQHGDLGEQDLADTWRNSLNKSNLAMVHDRTVKIADGVKCIVDGKPLPAKKVARKASTKTTSKPSPGAFSKFDTGKFRPHPLGSPFLFSRVNLIDGINGVGKTSLLETIEYFLSGSTSNEDKRPNNKTASIKACFDSDDWVEFVHDYDLFRNRDASWYKSDKKLGGSDLNKHFNRFNFYNSEAAFQLARGEGEELENSFRDIALGEEVSFIRAQMEKYLARLQPTLNASRSELSRLDSRIRDLGKQIRDYDKPLQSPDAAFDKAKKLCSAIFNNLSIPSSVDEDLSGFQATVATALSLTRQITKSVDWVHGFSISSFSLEQTRLRNLSQGLEDRDKLMREGFEKLEKIQVADLARNAELTALNAILPYFEYDFSNEILGLDERIKGLRLSLNPLEEISNIYSVAIANSLARRTLLKRYPKARYNMLRRAQIGIYNKATDDITSLSDRIAAIQSELSEIENIYAGLKASAVHLTELVPHLSDCPTCGEHYASAQKLLKRIKAGKLNNAIENDLSELQKKLKGRTGDRNKLEPIIKYLDSLDAIARLIKLDLGISLQRLHSQIESKVAKVSQLTRELERLTSLTASLRSVNLSEADYKEIAEKLKHEFDIDISVDTKESLQERLEKICLENQNSIQERESLQEVQENLAKEQKKAVQDYDASISPSHPTGVLKGRLATLERIEKNLKENEALSIKTGVRVDTLEDRLSTLSDTLDVVIERKETAQASKLFLSKTREGHEKVVAEKDIVKVKVNRLQAAVGSLQKLLENNDEKTYLSNFLRANQKQILDIFMAIHRPREFNGIKLSGGNVILKRSNGEESGLYEISSGQRSALALSIFLTLNSKLSADCPYMLFDDPITNVDDLNVLSFLDYLREIIIAPGNNRQIFFATASDDLAFLFEKKFEFLKEEFTRIPLSRLDA